MNHYESSFSRAASLGPQPPVASIKFLEYLRATRANVLSGYPRAAYEEWLVRMRYLGRDHFIVNEPTAIKRVLLENSSNYAKGEMERRLTLGGMRRSSVETFDETWRTRRQTMSSLFDYRRLPQYSPIITEECSKLLREWVKHPEGVAIDLIAAMRKLTSQVIARILIGSEYDNFLEVMHPVLEQRAAEPAIDLLDYLSPFNQARRAYRRFRDHRAFKPVTRGVDLFIKGIQENSESREQPQIGSLVSLLAEDRENSFTVEELRSFVITTFAAAHETTAMALVWTMYVLSQHPMHEARLHEELSRVLQGRVPSLPDLENLLYTRMVFEESLRLYPPFHMLAWREVLDQDTLCGQTIPKGGTVYIVPWLLHRHVRLWDDPTRFNPDRFLPERASLRPRMSFLPFGTGPRVCVGASFAMTEAILILATLLQSFRLRLRRGHCVEPIGRLILTPRFGMPMMLEARLP